MDAFERWELEEQLRHVARLLGPDYVGGNRPKAAAPGDAPSLTEWLAIVIGLTGLTAGGLLSLGGVWPPHDGTWKFGLALALLGQAALVIGLWRPRRASSPDGEL